jgi:hypothetical protein
MANYRFRQGPVTDERFSDRPAAEPDDWVPAHEMADYRFRR